MSEEITLRATVSRVFHLNEDAPWFAGRATDATGREISIAGKLLAMKGDAVELVGRWTNHEKYGRQFEIERGEVVIEQTAGALVDMIARSSDFQGVGPVRAKKVVDAAEEIKGDRELVVALLQEPEQIARISGVALDLVENIAERWAEKTQSYNCLAKLLDMGWTQGQANALMKRLGVNCWTLVEKDPFYPIGRLPRFGFRTCDAVAQRLGIKSTDPGRITAGVAYCLDRIADEGDTWTTREALTTSAVEELHPDTLEAELLIDRTIDELRAAGLIVQTTSPTGTAMVANSAIARKELQVFRALLAKMNEWVQPLSTVNGRAEDAVLSLNEGQERAYTRFSERRVSIVSGGAGVGKTYLVNAVCRVCDENLLDVALCAPTGKAAKRLEQATGRQASTIHRLLEPRRDDATGEFEFARGPRFPLDADLVVVDEVSMVDVRLMHSLLSAMPRDGRLLLVGDHHQIPSVGAGAILRDLLASPEPYASAANVLTEIHRQAGILARNTTALLDGHVVEQPSDPWRVQRTTKGHEAGVAAMVGEVVHDLIGTPREPFGTQLDFAWDVQVLAPMKKGPMGTYALNAALQAVRQRQLGNAPPPPPPENRPPRPLPGDRVIWIENDYELDLMNGTQAIYLGKGSQGSHRLFVEDGREVTIPAKKAKRFELAFAMTIHKSQGSEWRCVVLVVGTPHTIMFDRNLLYTGASRASEGIVLVGDRAGMRNFANTKRSARRQTLGGFLVHGWEPQPVAVQRGETTTGSEVG